MKKGPDALSDPVPIAKARNRPNLPHDPRVPVITGWDVR
jgi:hypothetical protein